MKLSRLTKSVCALVLGTILLVGCDGKDAGTEQTDKTPLSPEQAKQAIKTTMDDFYGCLEKVNDGGFANFFYNNFFIVAKTQTTTHTYEYQTWENGQMVTKTETYTNTSKSTWGNFLGDKFDKFIDGRLADDEGFRFQELKGTYTWNKDTENWEKTPNDANITLKFPSNKDVTTNDAVLVFKDYADEFVNLGGNTRKRLPKKGNLSVVVDGNKVFGVDLSNVKYSQQTNYLFVTSANVEIYVHPFTAKLDWLESANNTFGMNLVFSSPEGCSTKVKGLIKTQHSDYQNINPSKEIQKVDLEISHNDLLIQVNADVEALGKIDDNINNISETDLNNHIKAEVFKDGAKVADLKLIREDDGLVPYLYYSDKSKEKAQKFVSDFPEKFEQIFKRFIDATK